MPSSCPHCGGPATSICDECANQMCEGCTYTCANCGVTICPYCLGASTQGGEAVGQGEDYCEDCTEELGIE